MSDRKAHIKVLKQFLKDYQEWGEDFELEKSIKFAINSLEVDEAYQLEYEKATDIHNDPLGITEFIKKVATKATETQEKFIFETIKSWCEEIIQQEISKHDLEQALLQYYGKSTITLDELKEIRKEINKLDEYETEIVHGLIDDTINKRKVLAIIDKKISELEGKR